MIKLHPSSSVTTRSFLNEMIKERKRERRREAKRKLVQDREKMRNRSSAMNPLDLFPSEIWEKVLSYLEDGDDIDSASRSCTLFQEILESRRFSKFLLPSVLSILRSCAVGQLKSEREIQKLCHIRQVCKSWRDGYDAFIQRSLTKSDKDLYLGRDLVPSRPSDVARLASIERGTNFFLRTLSISFDEVRGNMDPDILDPFRTAILPFLDNVGSQITQFTVIALYSELLSLCTSLAQAYLLILKWIQKMKHLQDLHVNLQLDKRRCVFVLGLPEEDMMEELEDLEEIIDLGPYPFPRSIRKLKLDLSPLILAHTSLYESLIEGNPQLTELSLFLTTEPELDGVVDLSQLSDAISSLHLLESFSLYIHSLEGPLTRHLSSLLCPKWTLKKLILKVFDTPSPLDLNWLFRRLEEYEDLQVLELKYATDVIGDEECGFLHLPNLTSFTLELCDKYTLSSIDFMFPLKTLECLSVSQWTKSDEESDESGEHDQEGNERENLIQFQELQEPDFRPSSSNIWKVFPALKRVELKTRDNSEDGSVAFERVYFREHSN